MAAGNWTLYQAAKLTLTQGGIVLGTDTLVGVLVLAAYTPAVNTDATYANISANEATGTGYTAGGQVMTGVTDTATGGVVTLTSAALSWPSSTITAKYCAILKRAAGATASTDKLLCYVDLNSGGGSVSTTSGTLSITMNASGIFTLT